jgi:hypothetical protein
LEPTVNDDYERGRAEIIDRIEWYAKNAIDHAKSRVHDDGTALDVRQKAMLEAAERLAAWGRALKHKDASAYLYEPIGSKPYRQK